MSPLFKAYLFLPLDLTTLIILNIHGLNITIDLL